MIDAGASPETNSSLQYHLCSEGAGKLGSNTTLQLSGGVHYLEEGSFCLIQNLKNFKIQGQQTQPRTVIYCQSGTEIRRGIAFFNISNLHFSHLDIVNCGQEIPSTLAGHVNNSTLVYLGQRQKAVFIITHSINTTFESVSIERCFGFGMIFINPLGSTLIENVSVACTNSSLGISECTYSLEKRNDMLCAGSGVVFIFNDTDRVVKDGNYTAYLNIINCSFFNNTNMVPVDILDDTLNTLAFGLATKQFILVGGITIAVVMGQKNYFVNLRVANTALFSNTGNIGNFIVVHYNELRNGVTRLNGVVFSDNTVVGVTGRGAGLIVAVVLFFDFLSSFPKSHEDIYDLLEITSSDFSRNSALWGAALWFFMTPQNISSIQLVVSNTSFTNNVALIGPALYVFQSESFIKTKEIYVYLEDIVASGNSYPEASISENSPENSGALVLGQIANITVVGTEGKGCHFHNNTVSALLAVATNVVLRGRITFEDNRGFRGGALNLVDTSILLIHNGSNITLTRNRAFREGGAIYVNTGSAITGTCAIQFLLQKHIHFLHEDVELLNTSVVFVNNSAVTAGNSIFGNPLYQCLFLHISLNKYIFDVGSYEIIYKKVFDFQSSVGNNRSEFNSVNDRICICPNATFDIRHCTSSLLQLLQPKYRLNHAVIPGDTFVLFLNPMDVGKNPVTSFLYSFPRFANFSDSVSLDSHQNIRLLPGLTNSCSSVEFTVHAPENAMLEIDLFASIGRRKVTIELNTTSCPPGFELGSLDGSKRLSCVCNKFVKEKLRSTCYLTDYTVVRPPNNWIGTMSDDNGGQILQYVLTCPNDYCREDVTHVDLRVPDQVCVKGRTGTLCGACREGLSSVFGTAECQKCSHAWIALIPLFALIGIVVVITCLLLDLTITHGLINSFFFYSCIVVVNSNIFFQSNKSGFLFWFLSWTDMDSGFSMCFYDGMTQPAKLGLQYVFPSYTIVMIVVIIVLSQHSLLMQRIFSQLDGIHVLVSMLYISFLKLFHTVIDTFTFVNIVSENGEEDVVWFFDGTHQISDPISVFLILLGSLTMAGFIVPYVVFFTFSTYIQRYINSTRLNAYVDASLAPYKHKLRFWFGARLILTSLIYVIIANRGIDNPTFTLTLEVSLLVGFTIIQAYIHPFKRIGVALLDMFFLLNLIALTLGTLYNIQNENRYFDQKILVNTSVSISFVTVIGIILWHLMKRLRKNDKIKSKTDEMLASATTFLLALKMKKRFILVVKKMKRRIMTKREGEQSNGAEEREGGVLESTKYFTERSESAPPTTATTIISLKEMVAAPDDWQSQQSTSCQLREPVLDLVEK